jgi:hypothetical protein
MELNGLLRLLFVMASAALAVAACGDADQGGGPPKITDTGDAPIISTAMLPPVAKTVRSGDVTAHFSGSDVDPEALPMGITDLWFTFEGDGAAYFFTPEGELTFSDYRFEIFSPDGEHILLLQDRHGPYHIVALAELRDYLAGKAKPAHVFGETGASDGQAYVHSDGAWSNDDHVRYVVTCCGEDQTKSYYLPFPDYRPKESDDVVVDYRQSMIGQLADLPLAERSSIPTLINELRARQRNPKRVSGEWENGQMQLGANEREYTPSDDELAIAVLGDRLTDALAESSVSDVSALLDEADIERGTLIYDHFDFRHVDVLGSGRFFYASPPIARTVRLPG